MIKFFIKYCWKILLLILSYCFPRNIYFEFFSSRTMRVRFHTTMPMVMSVRTAMPIHFRYFTQA